MTLAESYCLGLLVEEFGEVLQWIGKAARFGIDSPDARPPTSSPRADLNIEIGDAMAAIEFAMRHKLIDRATVEARMRNKLAKLLDPASKDNLGRPLAPIP